ncbi:MAG: hypothetical protein ABDH21_02325 [bacterium]
MMVSKVSVSSVGYKKMPDYPKKDQKLDSPDYSNGKNNNNPDYGNYIDEYAGGGGGNYYEYSGPDGSYSYDPYH